MTTATSTTATLTKQEIYLSKRSKVIVSPGTGETSTTVLAAIQKNLESLGYILSPALCERLQTFSSEEIAEWQKGTVALLKKMVGAHRRYRPMYPNFPAQVMEASDAELYWNAIFHYFGAAIADLSDDPTFVLLPKYEKQDREPLTPENSIKLRVIGLGTEEDFQSIFTALCGANSSLSEADKAILSWFVSTYKTSIQALLPPSIPQKETLAMLVGFFMKEMGSCNFLLPFLKTATDVLRVAVVMSGGDVSLAKPSKFKKWSRKERRFLVTALEGCVELTEDLLRYPEVWKRLAHGLHVGDYQRSHPKTCEALHIVRNDRPFDTFNSKIELLLGVGDVKQAVELLKTRPGVFARRLDHVLRLGGGLDAVFQFITVADKVSTPVLVQVYNHFKNRQTHGQRVFFPKGNVGKMQIPDEVLSPLGSDLTTSVTQGVRNILTARLAKLAPLGNVYIDPALKTQIVPFAMRSSSKSLRTIARGSRMPLPEGSTVRFFLWWKDGDDRTDIDLSAVQLGNNFEEMGAVAYFNLRWGGGSGEAAVACHSGDITAAPNGACEFIDIDIERMKEKGVRFVVMCLNSFTHQSFCDLPECFGGWMMRSKPQSGEVFEAKTVQDKIDLASDSKQAIPVIIDLVNREVIWVDMSLTSRTWLNNVYSSQGNLTKLAKVMVDLNRPNLHDLFTMHAEARGTIVETESDAKTVFSMHKGVTPYDIDKILSEYLC